MVNRRTRADRKANNKKSNEKDDSIVKDTENDGDINESSDNIIDDSSVIEDSKKKPNNNTKNKKSPETEKSDGNVRRTRRSLRSSDGEPEIAEEENNKDLDDDNNDEVMEVSVDPVCFNDDPEEISSDEAEENNEDPIENNLYSEEANGDDPLNVNTSDVENIEDSRNSCEELLLNNDNSYQINEDSGQNDENSRSNGNDENSATQNDENSQQNGSEKDKNESTEKPQEDSQNDDDDKKPAIGLRLVPLNLLLRQDILNKQDDKKTEKPSRKSTGRNRKKASYIEISSDEDEQISINSSSSDSVKNVSSSDEDEETLSSLRRNTRKTKSTNSKLSNGTTVFKEPMSPTKLMKNAKSVSINLEKMPDNVNKLMKCYRVNDDPIEMWSESDDFENMISTSKIDRAALDKNKQDQLDEEIVKKKPQPREVRKRTTKEEKETEKPEKAKKDKEEKKNNSKRSKAYVEPTRSRSTRNAAVNRRKIVENDSSESDEDEKSDSESDDVPLKAIVESTTNNKPTKNAAKSRRQLTPESEIEKDQSQPTSTEQSKNNSEDESVKNVKNDKKEKDKDDHGKEKITKNVKRQESSSDEEEKEKESQSRSTRSTRNAKDQNAAKKSKTDSKTPEKEKETRSSPRKEKTSNLKITISLNQKKVINHSNENIEDSSKSDSDISTSSNSNAKNKKIQKQKKISSGTSSSDDEPLEALKNKSKEDENTSKTNHKASSSDASDREKSNSENEETAVPSLRKRNKFESNKEFSKLKELIEKKKKSKKKSDDEDDTKDSLRKNDKGKENHDENGEKESTNKTSKRKRVLSSSEEEEEKVDNKKQSSSKEDLETPAKKRKKKMDDDSDYNNSGESGEEEAASKNSDENSDSSDENTGKRKAKRSSEDDDDDDDIDDLEKGRLKAKRRKRIKKIASSDEDGDGDEKGKKASGRKMIRKILKNDKLDVSTKEAGKIEKERKQRIEERQKAYNQFYDERPEEIKEITKLVLDFDEETKEPLLQVDKKLVKKLKPHQANGIKFMWDACFESLERCRTDSGSGCILAHCMGLGKTLQVITLVHTLLYNSEETDVTRVLVVCPLNTVLNWVNEFNKWLKNIKGFEEIEVYELNKQKQNIDRANKLMEWHNEGGVMILSYDMFRNLTNDQNNRVRKKIKESLLTSLIDPGPDLVICDEGHLLKNEKTSISKCMMKLRTSRRIVLTGTPLQNNLKEYYCMVQFVKPNLLGKYQEYMNRFVNPITNGQYTDSTEYDIQVMRRRAHVLHKMLDGCVQRRDYSVLAPFLPPKHEYVLSIKLSAMQINLYKYYMEHKARQGADANRKGSILFQDFQNLQRIWSAPKALRYNSDRYEVEMQRKRDLESEDESEGSIKDFIDDSESAVSTSSSSSDDDDDDDAQSINSDEEKKKKKKKKKDKGFALPRRTRAAAAACPQAFEEEDEEIAISSKMENPTEWWTTICPEEELNNIEHSSKLMLLMSILEKCEAIGDKLLVFSQSLYSLDVIEHFLSYIDEQTQHNIENASFKASWTLGQDYFRLDGSTPVEQRNMACKHFNSPDNPRARLFLISTRAGGLGINLVAANRVVIFDVSWNPSHDIQSIFRVYRFGQTKPCYIYRFLALGTMEEKIYERQVTKQAISKRVIDEQQIDRHYNQNDLQELYKYELEPDDEVREIPILPKDRLFAEMLQKYEDMIWRYHEHDTLLENKEEETLNEEERKQAWEEFEQEKTRPQFAPYYPQMQQQQRSGPVTSNNIFGIRTDILLKLLSMKARLDNPSISEANVKHAIPLLMQELYRQMDRGELTLYQQLLALSSSLEAPTNYGGKFNVNEALMHQTYNSINSMPSTSSQAGLLYRSQLAARQQNLQAALQRKQIRRMSDTVIEID